MRYDYYAELAAQGARPTDGRFPEELVAGFVDECAVWSTRGGDAKNEARQHYIQRIKEYMGVKEHMRVKERTLNLPAELHLETDFEKCTLPSHWLALEVKFELFTPWYSKDDRVFHVLDNPVRKDRVFGVPFMAAASWKGMLRWACRMQAGLREHLEKERGVGKWSDPPWILHLFGNEKGETEHKRFHEGALVFYPTWFDQIGFEVINPHSRVRRAGTQPIYYEVVPPGAKGALKLLYAPLPGASKRDGVNPLEAVEKLLEAIEQLLTTYGISAKRTVGWGTAKIEEWRVYRKDDQPIHKTNRSDLWAEIQRWLAKEARP